jgi:hypothetical protein
LQTLHYCLLLRLQVPHPPSNLSYSPKYKAAEVARVGEMGRGSHSTLGNVFYCMRQIIFGSSAKAAFSLQANGKRSVGSEFGARGWGACTQQPRELAAEICRSVTD